jgi:hypothetical protein
MLPAPIFNAARAHAKQWWASMMASNRQREAARGDIPPQPPPVPLEFASRALVEAQRVLEAARQEEQGLSAQIATAEAKLAALVDEERGLVVKGGPTDQLGAVTVAKMATASQIEGLKTHGTQSVREKVQRAERGVFAAKSAEAETRAELAAQAALEADRDALQLLSDALEARARAREARTRAGRYMNAARSAAANADQPVPPPKHFSDYLTALDVARGWTSPTPSTLTWWRAMLQDRVPEQLR